MRYGLDDRLPKVGLGTVDPTTFAKKLEFVAKRVLRRDKQHGRMMFIRDGRGNWHIITLAARDRVWRHLWDITTRRHGGSAVNVAPRPHVEHGIFLSFEYRVRPLSRQLITLVVSANSGQRTDLSESFESGRRMIVRRD
jgi:hypothetical protein